MTTGTPKQPPGRESREDDRVLTPPTAADGNGSESSVLRPSTGKKSRRFLKSWKVRARGLKGSVAVGGDGNNAGNRYGNGRLLPRKNPSAPRGSKQQKPRIKKLRILFILLGLGILAVASTTFGAVMAVSQDIPAIERFAQFEQASNSILMDSQGEFIGTLSSNENRILLDADEISPNMKNAAVSIEDSRFYEHRGLDFRGLGRAMLQNILSASAKEGASTITQQLVKQALEAQSERTVFQKAREIAAAYHLEQQWTKDKILTEYLNTVYFGSGAYGIEAASRTYFGWAHPSCGADEVTCAELLTPAESALLAGIVQNPYGYDPQINPEASLLRRNTVLQKMYEQGYITIDQLKEAVAEALPPGSSIEPPKTDSKAPYFTEWVRQQMVDRYGAGRTFFGGLEFKTTLDLEVQAAAEQVVSETLGEVGPSASVVIINNKDATVDAMVAGPDFDSAPFNLATQGFRQPGSTVKPFILATALEQGISPYAVYESAPQLFRFGKNNLEYFPVSNYKDSYSGSSSLYDATTNSDNSVYAQVGLESIEGSTKAIARTIRRMGVWDPVKVNPAMVLGTSEVTPLEWTYAFSTLANDGRRVSGTLAPDPGDSPVTYTKVRDENGKTIRAGDNEVISTGVLDPEVALTTKSILSTVVSSGTGTNASIGDSSQWGKTGTTEDNTNAWFCGAITEVTACVWVGYPEGYRKMLTEYDGAPVDGGTYPALIWASVISAWQNIELNRVAERAAKAAGEEIVDSETGDTAIDSGADYSTPDYSTDGATAPEATAPAPDPAPTPAPAPVAPAPTSPTSPTGGGVTPGSGGASP
ncbi:MAG: transglycosylase domain-containing protein [Solirubrobacterales bacterium]